MNTISTSEKLFSESQEFIPGGVNSPARAFKSVGGNPIFFDKAQGTILTDVDGNEYIDFIGSWGPMILGHRHPLVEEAIKDALTKSTSFGAPTEAELKMAKLVTEMVPNVEKVRMVNSGTEATMSAVRVARGYTKREKIIKFEGNYHGHGDSFLIKAGSGMLTLGNPSSPGVTAGTAKDTLVADYNSLASVQALVDANPNEIAAIIVEPVAGNMGCIPPVNGFLEGLRALCDEHGIVLIFDEVMSGFRLSKAGAQGYYQVWADLVTFGKIIGAGLPVGAYGGKAEIMNVVAPSGPVYQAGTLSGNPLAMRAGYALLSELNNNPPYKALDEKTLYLKRNLGNLFRKYYPQYQVNRVGSMISFFFCDEQVIDYHTASKTNTEFFGKWFHRMLHEGVYLPPSNYESWFLNNAMDYNHLDKVIFATERVLQAMIEAKEVPMPGRA